MIFIIDTNSPSSLTDVYNYFRGKPRGTYRVEVTKVRSKRSGRQNKYLWGVVYPILLQGLIEEGWNVTNEEEVHKLFKTVMAEDEFIDPHTGEIIKIPSSTKEMSTVQFNTYINKLREYANEFLGVDIPDPE